MKSYIKTIDKFDGEYSFLSNFYYSNTIYEGDYYPTVEHAYQASKTVNLTEKRLIQISDTPKLAKKIGRTCEIRKDWENIKEKIMLDLLIIKFSDSDLRFKLMDTFPNNLIEGNTWGDKYWGKVDGEGKNRLGELLMRVRTECIQLTTAELLKD